MTESLDTKINKINQKRNIAGKNAVYRLHPLQQQFSYEVSLLNIIHLYSSFLGVNISAQKLQKMTLSLSSKALATIFKK